MKKLRESENIPGMKWFKGGSVYKPYFLSGKGVDAVAVDSYVDKLVKEHNNRFEIKDSRITEELYFEIQYWETGDGDNVYVDILFNREFDRDFDETKWGKKSYGATNEHGYVEELLNNGGLEKLGIPDAKIMGTGWDSSKHVPRWSIELFTFSDRNIDGTFKRPNTSDAWTSSHKLNGTEPFNKEEGKEISKAVMGYIVELFKTNPKKVYYEPSDAVTTVEIPEHRLQAYDPSWKGSYTHNTGWFGFSCYIEDAYDENAIDWRGRQGDTFRADEDVITALLRDKAAETLNDFLYEFNLEVVPDGCKAEWYHGSEEDDEHGHLFEVSIKFKEIGIDSDKSYYAHTGNSFKDYWPGSEPKDIYKGKTFKRNPKRVKEAFEELEPLMYKYKDVIVSSIDEGIANRETPKENIESTIYEVHCFFPEDDIDDEALRNYVSKKYYEKNPYEEEADYYLGNPKKMKESKNLNERVLDYDTWDKYYDEGSEAYFEGKALNEVPITGNAWFREAWEEGWKNAKACDDEDARRAEAEYEEELEWEEAYKEGLTESKMSEDRNYVVVKILDSFDTEARNVIESYGGQLDYDVWSISKENIQDVKDEISDWKNRIAFYTSYNYQSGRFGKKLTESKVILHFDLEDGEHKALPFESTRAAMEYMDSDDFPVGEWVGDYELEYVKETKPAEDDYKFQVLEPEDIEKLDELVKEIKDGNEDGTKIQVDPYVDDNDNPLYHIGVTADGHGVIYDMKGRIHDLGEIGKKDIKLPKETQTPWIKYFDENGDGKLDSSVTDALRKLKNYDTEENGFIKCDADWFEDKLGVSMPEEETSGLDFGYGNLETI